MHKIITIWIGEGPDRKGKLHKPFPYAGSGVGFNQSVGQIKDLLARFNCERIIDYSDKRKDDPHPMHTIGFEKDGLRYIVEFPVTYVEHSTARRLDMNVSGRIVFNRIKALLVDAEIEHLTFHEAMIPYLVLPTPQGTMSVMDAVQGQIDNIKKGTQNLFLLPGGR
ncbi:MAG: hypothetical protein M0Q91_05425 [Methanoregula sp.]|jgi:hypothetical protein|nr:hypothetical protein [Methanoregula sp.]